MIKWVFIIVIFFSTGKTGTGEIHAQETVLSYYILYTQIVPGVGTVDSFLFLVTENAVIQQFGGLEFDPSAPYKLYDIKSRDVFDIGGGQDFKPVVKMRQVNLSYDMDYVPDSSIIVRNLPVTYGYYTHREKIYDVYITEKMGIDFFLAGEMKGFPLFFELPYRSGLSKIISFAVRMKRKKLPAKLFEIPCCFPYGSTYDLDATTGKILPGELKEVGFGEKAPPLKLKLSTNERVSIGEENNGYSLLYFCHDDIVENIPYFLQFMNACSDSLSKYTTEEIHYYSIVKEASRKTHSELLLNAPNWNHATNAVSLWAKFKLYAAAYLMIIDPTGYIVYRQDMYDLVFDYTLLDQILFAIQESKRMNKG